MIKKVESLAVRRAMKHLAALKIDKNFHPNACSGEKINEIESFRLRFSLISLCQGLFREFFSRTSSNFQYARSLTLSVALDDLMFPTNRKKMQ